MAETSLEVKKSPAPARSTMPDPWSTMRSEMDRMFDRFASNFGFPGLTRLFGREPGTRFESTFGIAAPVVDVAEDSKSYNIIAELPGIDEKDIEVTLTGDMLVLKGEKRQESEKKDKNYYLSERSFGTFQRSFYLPEGVDREKIGAEFKKGVLTLTLPKTEQAQQQHKKIEVKAAS